jgi:hypothetical protein
METSRSKNRNDGMLSTLGPKKVTKIGILNVRTLYESGKIQKLETEMKKYKLDILGVSEVRWTQYVRREKNRRKSNRTPD